MALRIGLVALSVFSFFTFTVTNTVKANLTREDFYTSILERNDIYDRLFEDLLYDEDFEEPLDALLGGVNVERDDLLETIEDLVDTDYLQEQVDEAIEALIAYLRDGEPLDLRIDISPIVNAISNVAIEYTIAAIDALPTKQSGSYEQFESEFVNLINLLSGEGVIPDAIPAYPIPEENQEDVFLILVAVAGLDENEATEVQVMEGIAVSIVQDDVATAIKLSAASLLAKLIDASITLLTDNRYVETRSRGSTVVFRLGPPESVNEKLEDRLSLIRAIDQNATWLRPASLFVFFASTIALIYLSRRRPTAILRWVGIASLASGVFGFLAWLITKPIARDRITETVIARASVLPSSFEEMIRDVMNTSANDLTPYMWVPAGIASAVGAILLASSFAASKLRPSGA